jgi:hypothetical protein
MPAEFHVQNDCTTSWFKILPVFNPMKLTFPARRIVALLLASIGLSLSACTCQPSTPTATPTVPISTDTPTPTIVWFPPTNTPTFFPMLTPAPTRENHPGVGDLIFSDPFDQPQLWNTVSSEQASAAVTRNRLVLSINEPGPLTISSLRSQPMMDDFYAEVNVTISLCSSKDQYGMLFRAVSMQDYYRFMLNCSGQSRLERIRAGVNYPLSDWLSSGDVPLGGPAQVKLGVWVAGREMRVFLNDHFQISQLDPVFTGGTIGFFIYASGQSPITISFSDLSVYSVSYIFPTPTPLLMTPPTPSLTPSL